MAEPPNWPSKQITNFSGIGCFDLSPDNLPSTTGTFCLPIIMNPGFSRNTICYASGNIIPDVIKYNPLPGGAQGNFYEANLDNNQCNSFFNGYYYEGSSFKDHTNCTFSDSYTIGINDLANDSNFPFNKKFVYFQDKNAVDQTFPSFTICSSPSSGTNAYPWFVSPVNENICPTYSELLGSSYTGPKEYVDQVFFPEYNSNSGTFPEPYKYQMCSYDLDLITSNPEYLKNAINYIEQNNSIVGDYTPSWNSGTGDNVDLSDLLSYNYCIQDAPTGSCEPVDIGDGTQVTPTKCTNLQSDKICSAWFTSVVTSYSQNPNSKRAILYNSAVEKVCDRVNVSGGQNPQCGCINATKTDPYKKVEDLFARNPNYIVGGRLACWWQPCAKGADDGPKNNVLTPIDDIHFNDKNCPDICQVILNFDAGNDITFKDNIVYINQNCGVPTPPKPPNIWDQYKWWIIGGIVVFIVIIIIVVIISSLKKK